METRCVEKITGILSFSGLYQCDSRHFVIVVLVNMSETYIGCRVINLETLSLDLEI